MSGRPGQGPVLHLQMVTHSSLVLPARLFPGTWPASSRHGGSVGAEELVYLLLDELLFRGDRREDGGISPEPLCAPVRGRRVGPAPSPMPHLEPCLLPETSRQTVLEPLLRHMPSPYLLIP